MVTRRFGPGPPDIPQDLAGFDRACHIARMRLGIPLLALTCGAALVFSQARAQETPRIVVVDRDSLSPARVYGREPIARPETRRLVLTLVYFTGGGWSRDAVLAATRDAVTILAQCDVLLQRLELVRVDAPARFRYFDTPISRELARALQLSKPTVYFVADTRQQPAFDAEAIGRGNSKSRPELTDTVWLTRAARDLGIALAHELAHVLTDSGAHVDRAGNLMSEQTTPKNTQLTAAQCARMRDVGTHNGLLRSR